MTAPLLIIGAQKAGTTWLRRRLLQSPLIGGDDKEHHYWDHVSARKKPRNDHAYLEGLMGSAHNKPFALDCTPAYATLDEVLVSELYAAMPGVKALMLLREPRSRAWSAAEMFRVHCQLSPSEVTEGWYDAILRSEASRRRGDYQFTLSVWASHLGSDSLWVGTYEQLKRSAENVAEQVLKFLVPDGGSACIGDRPQMPPAFVNRAKTYPPPAIKTLLDDLYADSLPEVVRYLSASWGVDAREWLLEPDYCQPGVVEDATHRS